MKKQYTPGCISFLVFLAANLSLCAQTPSSIYLDSRDVANYIRSVPEPYIDASKVKSIESVSVFRFEATEALVFPSSKRLLIPEDGGYTLVMKLQEADTIFVVGRQRRFITQESADDTVKLKFVFTTDLDSLPPQILYADTSESFRQGFERILYGPTDDRLPLQAATKLAYHLYSRQSAKLAGNFPLEDLQLTYANNPFMAKKIMERPIMKDLNTMQGRSKSILVHLAFWEAFSKAYPWQAVLDGDSTLQLNQQVSFEDQRASYRDQIISSEKALSMASQQINQTSRQGGLFDARTVAVGMSDFIAERAQEELNLTFFERFKTNMRDTNELTLLFPKTRDLLVDFDISNYKTLLSHARLSFETDLGNIGLNFPKILSLPKYDTLRNDPNVFNLALIYSLADLAYKEYAIEDILLYACQSLNLRNKELDKAVNLRIMDRLLGSRDSIAIDLKLGSLDTLRLLSEQALICRKEAEDLMFKTSRYLRTNSSILNSDNNDFLYRKWQGRHYSMLFVRHQDRIATYLSGRKYYNDLIANDDNISEAIFEREFIKGKNIPEENYTQGLVYVSLLRDETIVPELRQRQEELSRYIIASRATDQKNSVESISDSILFQSFILNFEKYRLLKKAWSLELDFWNEFKRTEGTDDHNFAGLEYLGQLIDKEFPLFSVAENSQLYNHVNYVEYEDYVDLEDYIKNNLLKAFQEENEKEKHAQFEQDLGKYKGYLEEQIKRLYQANSHRKERLVQRLSILKDTFNTVKIKLEEYGQIHDSLYRLQRKIVKEKEDATGYSKLYKDLVEGPYNSFQDSLLGLLRKESAQLYEEDTIYHKLSSLIAEAAAKKEKAKESVDEKKKTLASSWSKNLGETSTDLSPFSVPDRAYHNPYLDQLAHSLVSEPVSRPNILEDMAAQIGPAIEGVAEAQEQLAFFLNTLENRYCLDLVKAKRNAANLHTSMELSMHLLSAFRNPEMPLDSIFIPDSLLVAVTTISKDSGITRSYNTLLVREKYISDKNLKLPGSRWISKEEFNELKNDPLQWNIFLGMLYERMRRVEGAPDFSATGVALLTTKFFDIIHEMDEHREQVRLKKAMQESIGFKDYYPFIKSTVDLFNTVINTPVVGTNKLVIAEQFESIQKVSEISDAALSMYENIYVKNYGNAIRNAMTLMSIFTNSEYDPHNPIYNRMLHSELDEGTSEKEFKKQLKKQHTKIRKSRRAINAVLTYGTFMADMIDAQTSEQVKNILQSATLPPGSSRIKREVSSNFTINSYLGGGVAYDRINENLPGFEKGAIGASMSVPVGFTYSFSPDRIFKRGGSFSIHVPIFDLGAITAFRSNPSADNYQVEQLPDFTWKNLFAPGAFFVLNIRNSPFSLGAGGQIGPQLRQITNVNTLVTTTVHSTRFPMVFCSVDVPFFNLHTGAKKIVVD